MNLVITMSSRHGAGASTIAEDLSEKLDIPVFDRDYIESRIQGGDFSKESEFVKELAKEPCIILGRCTPEILKGQSNVFNIYLCADKEDRIERVMEKADLGYEDAKAQVERNDRQRAEFNVEHTGKVWGDVNSFQMILDTSRLGIENCADILIKYFEKIGVL